MSTVPPPYSYDPKSTARAARMQAKSARMAYKAQRDLYRQQQRHLRRGSILGPILLVGAGVVALFLSTGHWSALAFTAWYARWWPLVLVLAGVILLAEWGFDQYVGQTATTPPLRRRVGGGVVFLLILVGIFGATSRTVHDQNDLFTNGLSINSGNFAEMFSDKHDLAPQTLDETLPPLTPGLALTVDNPYGDILVTGKSPDGNLHITVEKHVYSNDSDLQRHDDELTPQFTASSDGLRLSVPRVARGSADLTLLVPDSLILNLDTRHGDVKVDGMKAAVSLSAYGDVELDSIAGNVTARLSHSHSDFKAHNVTGDLSLRGTVGDLSLTDITGTTYLEGAYEGEIHFERLLGPVTFQSSRTHLTLARVDGHVDIDSDSISGDQLVGPVNVRTTSRNLNFDKLSGDLDVVDTNGIINVNTARPGNISVINTNDAINLIIPDRTGVTVTGSTTGGQIETDFNIPVNKSQDRSNLQGTIGDGKYHINLQTTHDNISLRKASQTP